jgi:hypothetical protein
MGAPTWKMSGRAAEMISREQIAKLLQAPAETTSVDYKLRLNWGQKAAQLELLRDLACLANRAGGFLGIGVRDGGGGRLEVVGIAADDPLPDVTQLAQLFREYFAPTVPIEVVAETVDGKAVGVIAVAAFERTPVMCRRDGVDGAKTILRRGAIYSRTNAAACEEASPDDLDRMLNQALENRVGSFQRMAGAVGEEARAPSAPAARSEGNDAFTHRALQPNMTLRAADFYPLEALRPTLRLSEIETLVEQSRVRGGGGAFFPRYMDRLAPPYVLILRHPDRLVLSTEGDEDDGKRMAIVASMTRAGVVRVRETLWEDFHGPIAQQGGNRLGISTTSAFAMAALLFAYRYYGSAGIAKFRVRLGLVAPEGRMLFMDSDRRVPLLQAYRATTTEDLFIERELSLDDITTFAKRSDIAFSIVSELYEFFGFGLTRDLFDGLVAESRYVEMEGVPPVPLRPSRMDGQSRSS